MRTILTLCTNWLRDPLEGSECGAYYILELLSV